MYLKFPSFVYIISSLWNILSCSLVVQSTWSPQSPVHANILVKIIPGMPGGRIVPTCALRSYNSAHTTGQYFYYLKVVGTFRSCLNVHCIMILWHTDYRHWEILKWKAHITNNMLQILSEKKLLSFTIFILTSHIFKKYFHLP